MRYCFCGKPIPRRQKRGGREKEYCCDAHQQQACRARNKGEHDLERIKKEADERLWNKAYQDVHRETWQNELEEKESYIGLLTTYQKLLQVRNEELQIQNNMLREYVDILEGKLADRKAEIVRLNVLLEGPKKRRPVPQHI